MTGERLLEGKTALVTGASRGIGAATATAFADAGAAVVLAARDEEALRAVAATIVERGGQAHVVPTDVTDAGAVRTLVERTIQVFGRLDVAFNNAAGGGHRSTPLTDVDVDAFDSAVNGTLRSVFVCMKHEIAAMLHEGGGAIVNMASTAGVRGVPGVAGYVASKHGVIGLTRSAALDYAAAGIRVNAVAPGQILTHRLAGLPDTTRESIEHAIPMRRMGPPDEVAHVVVWLCSDQASFITGATMEVDGGKLAAGA